MPIQTQRVLLAFLCLVIAATLLAAEPNLSGTWTATVSVPVVPPDSAALELEQRGDKLAGKITNSYGRESEVTGMITGDQIQLSYASSAIRLQTDSGVTPLTLNFSGTVTGDEIDAKATTPVGEATLKAKRK